MRDGIDFQREVARFSEIDVAYIVDLLRGVYKIVHATDDFYDKDEDTCHKMTLGDFIAALDECDSIEIVRDEEMLVED